MKANGHCVEHEIPWLTFPAISQIDSFLKPSMRVFEYGSGGSTLFFARRVREVVSIEHDDEWYTKLQKRLENQGIENCSVHHIPPSPIRDSSVRDPADPDDYVSSNDQYSGKCFREYVTKIEDYPDHSFDVVVVDGRARSSCFKHAISKVRTGGLLVFDNTDRGHYHRSMTLAPDHFKFTRCPGPTPFLTNFTETSLWKAGSQ
jgi:tRNA A58 N-methylase Trm61